MKILILPRLLDMDVVKIVKPTDFTAVVGHGCSQVKILILINMGMCCFTNVNIAFASFAFASLVYLKKPICVPPLENTNDLLAHRNDPLHRGI